MKKIATLCLSLVLLFSFIQVPSTSAASNETISAEMQAMIDIGVISGYGDGTYRPYGKVTRAEFATFISRALKLPEGEPRFKDVNVNSKLAPGINAAAKAKIVQGVTTTTFSPNSLITREQMALMINNALTYLGVQPKSTSIVVLDRNEVTSSVTMKAIYSMMGLNIIKGYEADGGILFKPKQNATREHAAAFINRLLTISGKMPYVVNNFEKQVVELVNEERAKKGLKPLILDTELSKVARFKSQDMNDNKYFDHNSPTYGNQKALLSKFGISYYLAGENIAMGQRTPEEVMNSWMNSEGHRNNILNANFTHIGVGYYGSNLWTQEFITKP
nr:S-layer homology domain-containing protein [Bacillus massiliigorillae]